MLSTFHFPSVPFAFPVFCIFFPCFLYTFNSVFPLFLTLLYLHHDFHMFSTCFPSFPYAVPIICLCFHEISHIFKGKQTKYVLIRLHHVVFTISTCFLYGFQHFGLESLLLITKNNKQQVKGSFSRDFHTLYRNARLFCLECFVTRCVFCCETPSCRVYILYGLSGHNKQRRFDLMLCILIIFLP